MLSLRSRAHNLLKGELGRELIYYLIDCISEDYRVQRIVKLIDEIPRSQTTSKHWRCSHHRPIHNKNTIGQVEKSPNLSKTAERFSQSDEIHRQLVVERTVRILYIVGDIPIQIFIDPAVDINVVSQ